MKELFLDSSKLQGYAKINSGSHQGPNGMDIPSNAYKIHLTLYVFSLAPPSLPEAIRATSHSREMIFYG